jgi:prepilin-type N-terminal cleavage/methylation domain-containing protein
MIKTKHNCGFTLAELLVAMVVTGIILAAVATLAYAMSSSSSGAEDISFKQAQVRFASLRLSELIHRCRLVYSFNAGTGSVVLWLDNNLDNAVSADELVTIEAGASRNYIKIQEPGVGSFFAIPQCSSVQFTFDQTPPRSKTVNIAYQITEDGIVHQYRLNASLRSWAGNLLNGSTMVSDDD